MRVVGLILSIALLLSGIGAALILHPDTPLPDHANPLKPLDVADPVTGLTGWKLRRALSNDDLCLEVLATGADFLQSPPLRESDNCGIAPRVTLNAVGETRLKPVETRCQTALRLTMWVHHGLQTAALRHMGSQVREIKHYSSYSCRTMRTGAGGSERMSTHATANAIDVSGFVLTNGQTLELKRDWSRIGPAKSFLEDSFQAACLWFPVALGPNYNALHADHFHLQTTGWGLCR